MSEYPLDGVVRYFRKRGAAALLFAMFRHVSETEKTGSTLEMAQAYFTGDSYVGITFVTEGRGRDDNNRPTVDA